MGSQRSFPPQPSVEHLTTIFRRIESGKIVVPAFQRTFVWERSAILELLESVHAGYPIGSVLLWAADQEFLRVSDATEIPFPNLQPQFPVNYVLDGLQRLSTLYGVFHFSAGNTPEMFDVSFDLKKRRFVPSVDAKALPTAVPLSSLFNPRRLLDVQKSFLDQGLPETVLSDLTDLQARFQEYMIPLVTLSDRSIEEVVVIFERVNSTGTKLSRVDFMRAITWSEDFDLNSELDRVKESLDSQGFDISDDTTVKALGLVFGLEPLPNILLDLRARSASELKFGIDKAITIFRRVFEFFREELSVYSSDFVPYEGQILTLFKVFENRESLTPEQISILRSWFFWISFDEVLQGKPDSFVSRMIRSVESQVEKSLGDLPAIFIDPNTFIRRRMLKGKALTTAFITLMSRIPPHDLVTGGPVLPGDLTTSYNTNRLVAIVDAGKLKKYYPAAPSTKIPANVLVVGISGNGNISDPYSYIMDLSENEKGREILASHLIFLPAIEALKNDDYAKFLELRAGSIAEAVRRLISISPSQ